METQFAESREELASVLAILIASKGRVDTREWQELAKVDAYHHIGVSPARFLELVQTCLAVLGANLLDHQWLSPENLKQIDRALARVTDLDQQLLVCGLAADILRTEDHVSGYDGLVLDHALARWHLTKEMISGKFAMKDRAAGIGNAAELPV
jgi:hypothetical protein